ncbi:uncharacterized protein LOC123721337 [Papilio machaon]|uniref:uncharacterized protein LOC123721337 n=1 Tax=Papilio machaon TaxID=76193 RepID=UPI001E663050|nr:uncharacterized protein LOC123721337 [Papilio machaon]
MNPKRFKQTDKIEPRRRCARLRPAALTSLGLIPSTSEEDESPTASEEEPAPSTPPRRPVRGRGRPPSARLGPAGRIPHPAPATGGVVRRMRWTSELNESVMRAYYQATEVETNLTAYRGRMLSLFQVLQPNTAVTAQRLSDQVRVILRSRRLDDSVLDRLRTEIRSSLRDTESAPTAPLNVDCVDSRPPTPIAPLNVGASDTIAENVSSQDNEHMRRTLEEAIKEFKDVPTLSRSRLPRLPIHRGSLAIVNQMNALLAPYFDASSSLAETHSILYCGAVAVCRMVGVKLNIKNTQTVPHTYSKPAWQARIERRINTSRTLIAKLLNFRAGNTRPKVMRFVTQAFFGTNISPNNYILRVTERIDFYKQKICAWANRIRRYKKRADRFILNRRFQSDQKGVYRGWEQPSEGVNDRQLPNPDDLNNFWRGIWSVSVNHKESDWVEAVGQGCEQIPVMDPVTIEPCDVSCAIRSAHNWKSPGPDGLPNFWIKWFKSSHFCLAAQFQAAIDLGSLPTFMTTGVTHLLFKSGCTTEAKNYRPITCLPTLYKLLTSILSSKLTKHLKDLLAKTQNGCRPGSRGTKELLLIDMTINQQVRRNRKNLCTAWVDYKKAYDSVPHSWLRRVLELYKVDVTLCTFLSSCMRQWVTRLSLPGSAAPISNGLIKIERGIFQGDSLSPLWFCLALNPLSTLLNESRLGFQLRRGGEVISHLLYMDDLKLFASKKTDLVELLKITEKFSSSIGMEFGVEKCAVMYVQRGRVASSDGLQLTESMSFRSLSEGETYKYLGISQSLGIVDEDVKHLIKARFIGRLRKVLNSLLSGGNKFRAFNSWVMPSLTYSFGILRWTQTELDILDRRVRCMLTTHRMHHPRSSVMRLYIPRKCGGRGLLNAKDMHNREVYNLREYFLKIDEGIHRDVVSVDKGLTPLSLNNENWRKHPVLSTSERLDIWKSKELHGRFYRALHGPDVDLPASVNWLRFGDLFGETEGFVCAIMDEVIKTNNYRKYIMRDGTLDVCRLCHCPGESLRHVTSGCSRLANSEYLHRHNLVARIIHQQLALKYGLIASEVPYYKYTPEPVLDDGHITLYWDRSIITDRTIVANKPDIVIIDRSARHTIIVDVSIPHDCNLVKAETDKMSKYLDLAHEITAMWHMESTIIVPIVLSVNGLIAKSLDHHLERLSLGKWVKGQAQKAVLLSTARIVRRFLSLEA